MNSTPRSSGPSAAKTAEPRKYFEVGGEEDQGSAAKGVRTFGRCTTWSVIIGDQKQITTQEAMTKLREIPTSPWRRFRGDGLKDGIEGAMVVAGLLSRFGVKPSTIRIAAKNLGTGSTAKGYKRDALLSALAGIDGSSSATVRPPADADRVPSGPQNTPELLTVLNNQPTFTQDCGGCFEMHRGILEFKLKNPSMPNEEIAKQSGVSQLIVRQALTRFSATAGIARES